MAEYQYFDGESFITFNIVYATEKEVQLAITNRGRITVTTYDLYTDSNGNEYFEYPSKEALERKMRSCASLYQ